MAFCLDNYLIIFLHYTYWWNWLIMYMFNIKSKLILNTSLFKHRLDFCKHHWFLKSYPKHLLKKKILKCVKKNHKVNIRSFKRFRYDKYMQVKGFTEFLFKGFLHTLIKEFTIICQLLTTYCHRLIIKSYFTFLHSFLPTVLSLLYMFGNA